jgi:hypothetical protein
MLSLKIDDSVFEETEALLVKIRSPQDCYIFLNYPMILVIRVKEITL